MSFKNIGGIKMFSGKEKKPKKQKTLRKSTARRPTEEVLWQMEKWPHMNMQKKEWMITGQIGINPNGYWPLTTQKVNVLWGLNIIYVELKYMTSIPKKDRKG